jgi:hypothetical protein
MYEYKILLSPVLHVDIPLWSYAIPHRLQKNIFHAEIICCIENEK